MTSLKEFAQSYESKLTKNIADLPEVSVEFTITDDEFEYDEDGKTKVVKQKVINVNGENYRVPNSVTTQVKILLEDNPHMKKFKVKKSGSGMETKYQVIPLM